MFLEVFLLIVAFIVIWLSTGFAIEAIEKISTHSKLTKFTLSLFVIGIVTSLPEVAVTVSSVMLRSPQIAMGNLIGSQIFLLFFVIPVLAILSKGLHLRTQLKNVSIALTLLVALVPIVTLYNQGLGVGEAVIILVAYAVFVFTFARRENFLERVIDRLEHPEHVAIVVEVAKLAGAVAILFLASNTVVRALIEISSVLQTPRFLLSLLILPIGTNLPELSLALGSLAAGKKDFALSDYMGAITFNSLLIAVLALSYGGIVIGQDISLVILAFIVGVVVFWWCCFSKELLSVKEGLLLFLMYVFLLVIAIWQIMTGIYSH